MCVLCLYMWTHLHLGGWVSASGCMHVYMCVYVFFSLCVPHPQSVTGSLKELFPVGMQQPEPLVARLQDHRLLLQRDKMSIFINAEGEPTQREPINWSDIPVAIGVLIGPTSLLIYVCYLV